MTLKEQIAADASTVFLNQDDFGETVTRYIHGELNDSEEITAVVELDDEQGMNEAPGEGRHLPNTSGIPLLRSCKLEITAAKAEQLRKGKDKFVIADGSTFTFDRVLGRDNDLATVLCFRSEQISRKLAHPRP